MAFKILNFFLPLLILIPLQTIQSKEEFVYHDLLEGPEKHWALDYIGHDLISEKDYTGVINEENILQPVVLDTTITPSVFAQLQKNLGHPIKWTNICIANDTNADSPPSKNDHAVRSLNAVIDPKVGTYHIYGHSQSCSKKPTHLITINDSEPELQASLLQRWTEGPGRVANASLHFLPSHPTQMKQCHFNILREIDRLEELKKILVMAMGNAHPSVNESQKIYLGNRDSIIRVGALDPSSYVSANSQQDEFLDILAPGNCILSKDAKGREVSHDLTSAASPLVAGIIMNVVSILPGITSNDLKVLLRKTAIKTLIQKMGSARNGPGMVNSYKMMIVALRIAEQLKNDKNKTISEIIREGDVFNFTSEVDHELQIWENSKRMDIKSLRKAFYLQPCKESAVKLRDYYKSLEMPNYSLFYDSIALAYNEQAGKKEVLDFLIKNKGEARNPLNPSELVPQSTIMIDRLSSENNTNEYLEALLSKVEKMLEDKNITLEQKVEIASDLQYVINSPSQYMERIEKIFNQLLSSVTKEDDAKKVAKIFIALKGYNYDPIPESLRVLRSKIIKKNINIFLHFYITKKQTNMYLWGDEENIGMGIIVPAEVFEDQ